MGEAGWDLSSLTQELAGVCFSFKPDIFIGYQVHTLSWKPVWFWDVGLMARDAETLEASSELGPHKWERLAEDSPCSHHQPLLPWDWFRDEGCCSFSQLLTQPFAL